MASKAKIVLGIDPGSQVMGFGAVKSDGHEVKLISYGTISPPSSLDFNERIGIIAEEIEALIERLRPDVTVVEQVFLGKNADSAFKLGHARGVVIAAAIRAGSRVVEYATRAVKKGITGNGGASKEQVQLVLFATLGVKDRAKADASDALALAFYHARNLEVFENIEKSRKKSAAKIRTEAET